MGDFALCGWRVRSAIPFPELFPWEGDGREPDIHVLLGELPADLAEPVHRGHFLQVDAAGRCRLSLPGVATFLIEGGRTVTVSPEVPTDSAELGTFLLGSVLGLLCHQRGALPVHASCVEIDGRAVAFAGPSGAGKSTLAAALVAQGHRLVSDDVTVIAFRTELVVAVASYPRQKLWRDSIEALGLSPGRVLRPGRGMDKYEVRPSGFAAGEARLHALCHLVPQHLEGRAPVERLQGLNALRAVQTSVYRQQAGGMIAGGHARLLAGCASLAQRVPQFRLSRPVTLRGLADWAGAVAGDIAGRR